MEVGCAKHRQMRIIPSAQRKGIFSPVPTSHAKERHKCFKGSTVSKNLLTLKNLLGFRRKARSGKPKGKAC